MSQSDWWDGDFPVTQGYGPASYEGEPAAHGVAHWHAGIDFGLPAGRAIIAAVPCKVTTMGIGSSGGFGNLVICTPIDDRLNKWSVYFGHNASFLVGNGAIVPKGAQLALTDSTGNSTGDHIHFEVRPAGGPYGSDVDPSFMLHPTPGKVPDGQVFGLSANTVAWDPLQIGKTFDGMGRAISDVTTQAQGTAEVAGGGLLIVVALTLAMVGLLWEELPIKQLVGAIPGVGPMVLAAASAARKSGVATRTPQRAMSRAMMARMPRKAPASPRGAPAAAQSAGPVEDATPVPDRDQKQRMKLGLRALGFRPAEADEGVNFAFRPGTSGDDTKRLGEALKYLGSGSRQHARA